MQTKIATWGHSSAVRIPADLAEDAGLTAGTPVRLVKTEHGILIERAAPRYTLDELLAGITPDNTPGEIDWGKPVGREIV